MEGKAKGHAIWDMKVPIWINKLSKLGQDSILMGDHLGTPCAAGIGCNNIAANRQVDSV